MFSLRRAALTVNFRAFQSLDPFDGKDINLHQNSDSIFDMVTFFFFFFSPLISEPVILKILTAVNNAM